MLVPRTNLPRSTLGFATRFALGFAPATATATLEILLEEIITEKFERIVARTMPINKQSSINFFQKKTLYYYMYIISGASFHIIAISFFVYIFVNLFENIIHYNIGRFSMKETKLEIPSKKDFIQIFIVMCVFALLQGCLTNYFTNIM
jgi:hypothetical protein